ncbi:FAD-binding oxidoreductase [Actinoplanes sp. NPDC051494]|uniref:FAD-binding oxidoreductase n=1 Tax=Actinoplanes sp. NPDC051494 TaxID=3363907 RepID=UPI00379F24CD
MTTRRSLVLGGGGVALAAIALPGAANARPRLGTRPRITDKWSRLRDHLQGRLVLPTTADYQTAKQLFQVQFDTTDPRAIAYCASAADVALCLRFAQDCGIPVAARSGGHSAGGYSTTTGLVIDVSGLNAVVLNSDRTSVRIGPGAQLIDIMGTLAPAGLAISGGYCPTVAAGGFLQGGGMGLFTRSIGMASDKVTSAQVVLANGSVVTASATQNPELFWALRGGGGGNFGIVTSYEITPTAITNVAAANLVWSYDKALDMLDGWTRWLEDSPWSIGGGANVTLFDAAPGAVPTAGITLGSVDTGPTFAAEVQRLIAAVGSAPVVNQGFTAPYQPIMMNLYRCGELTAAQCHRDDNTADGQIPRPAFGAWRGRLFNKVMPRDGWSKALTVVESTARVAGQSRQLQISALGGQANTVSRTATAYVHRDTRYSASFLTSNAETPTAEVKSAAYQFVDSGFAAVDPYSNGETYQNFIDPRLPDWKRSYYGENYSRLMRVKKSYDPHNFFRFAQSVR